MCRTRIAEMLLEGKIHDGEKVEVSANKDGLVINGQPVKMAA
jgi:hypothetical protein